MQAKLLAQQIKFDIGETVEFAIRSGKDTGIVGNIRLCPGCILYSVVWSDKSTRDHYEFELQKVGTPK